MESDLGGSPNSHSLSSGERNGGVEAAESGLSCGFKVYLVVDWSRRICQNIRCNAVRETKIERYETM